MFLCCPLCFNATDPVIPVYSSISRSNTRHVLNVTCPYLSAMYSHQPNWRVVQKRGTFQWDSTGLARRSSVVKSLPLPQLPTRASCFHFAPRDSLGFFWWEDELADVSRMKLQMSQRVRMLQSLQMSSSQKLNSVCHSGVWYGICMETLCWESSGSEMR